MAVRYRSRDSAPLIGGHYYFGTTGHSTQTFTAPAYSEYCEDIADQPGVDHPFLSRKLKKGYVQCSGGNGLSGNNHVELQGWIGLNEFPAGIALPSYSATTLATQALALTNPSRPAVNLGLAISEMRDLPRMFQLAGRNLIKKGASAYLLFEFGWRPFFSDFAKLVTMGRAVNRRVSELKRLRDGPGLKRRITLQRDFKTVVNNNVTLNSVGSIVKGTTTESVSRTIWATCRWKPNTSVPYPDTDFEQRLEMFGLMTGTHAGNLTVSLWDALPWSWLADYFANVGDFLQATNNVLAHPSGPVNVMATYKTTKSYAVTSKASWLNVTTVPGLRLTKERLLGSAGLTASIPVLSGRQLSILGSLGITRMRGVL